MNKNEKQITKAGIGSIVKKEIKEALGEQNKRNLAVFATKEDLKKAFAEQNERNLAVFVTKDDLKESERRLEQKLTGKLDEFVIRADKIYAKLEKKELEGAAHHYMHKSAEDRLADHDKRLGKLERVSA